MEARYKKEQEESLRGQPSAAHRRPDGSEKQRNRIGTSKRRNAG